MPDFSIAEPVDLADVRSYLAMEPDDETEDPLLSDCIAFCRDRLESVLPYWLAEREVTVHRRLCSWGLPQTVSMELRGPVLGIERVSLAMRDRTSLEVPAKAWFEFDGELSVDLRCALCDLDPRPVPVGMTVEYRAGAHVPPLVKNALLMMIRNRYERRDEDPLTDAIMSMVYPETRPNI